VLQVFDEAIERTLARLNQAGINDMLTGSYGQQ
jgi:hypothetical protein